MRRSVMVVVICLLSTQIACSSTAMTPDFRPPAVPLVACDPYFSIWSFADRLTDKDTTHWTGHRQALTSLIRIDGKTFRLMGSNPEDVPALPQTGVQVLPTRTIYAFEGSGVRVNLIFMQAALPDDIDLLSRPVVHVIWECVSTDNKRHDVSVYYDNSAEVAVHEPSQAVVWSRTKRSGLTILSTGTESQPVLVRKGDNVRIDWGCFYAAAVSLGNLSSAIASATDCRTGFTAKTGLPAQDDSASPRAVNDGAPVLALVWDIGRVGGRTVSCQAILAYDDLYSVKYFGRPLRPYWRRNGADIYDVLAQSVRDFSRIKQRCEEFDRQLMTDLAEAGGQKYALIASLAYRQCIAANKIVADDNGMPLMFSKENFSNGCMGTADVFYPMAPQFLLLNPGLMKATVVPMLDYAASDRWPFPFSPHDLGTYPHAGKQAYGGGERSEENQMPVEECGNMLILMAAIAKAENSAELSGRYWPLLTTWAEYLKAKGLDPENQLCTDDFAGHLAHNVNLSVKAILGMACYGKLAAMLGHDDTAQQYRTLAVSYAKQWQEMADDGDHYRLTFDKSETWSQKYNLVWDRLLGLDIFPATIAQKEMAWYRKAQNTYGLPLDNRSNYTKLDWILWTATTTGNGDDFAALIEPVFAFLNETPDRVPMTDWYWTHNARIRGFQARPVVGGVFIRMLDDSRMWSKWAKKAEPVKGQWAAIPKPPIVKTLVDTAQTKAFDWSYTTTQPGDGWMKPDYDAGAWRHGPAGFGTRQTPGAVVGTVWSTSDIWMRRAFDWSPQDSAKLHLLIHHDEDVEVYINGVSACKRTGYTTDYEPLPMTPAAVAALRPGENTIAVHCHQTGGGQYIDVGIANVIDHR